MGFNWKGIGEGFVGDTIGAIGGGIVNSLFGPSAKKQMKMQLQMQKELNRQAAQLNYEYGELSAMNAYNRQMKMYERSYNDQSYKAMRGQMEDAGLSVGLMYGGTGSGGGQGAMTGAPQGATGGAIAGDAAMGISAAIALKQLKLQERSVFAQNAKAFAEAEETKARTKKEEAETAQTQVATQQAMESFEWTLQNLKEESRGKWIENEIKIFNAEVNDLAGEKEISSKKFGKLTIKASAFFNNEVIKTAIENAIKKEDVEGANMLRKAQAAFHDEKTKYVATEAFAALMAAKAADTNATTNRLEYGIHKIATEAGVQLTKAQISKIAQDIKLTPEKVEAEIEKMEAEEGKAEFESGGWAKAKVIFTCLAALGGAYAGVVGTNAKFASAVAGK